MLATEFLARANAFDHADLTFREALAPGVEFRAHAVANPVHPLGGPYDEAVAIWCVGSSTDGGPVPVSSLGLPALRRLVELAEACEAWGRGGAWPSPTSAGVSEAVRRRSDAASPVSHSCEPGKFCMYCD